jgi:replicative DNA helicase
VTRLDISPLARVVARADRARDGEADPTLLPTGFPSIDRAIGGGLRRGDLIVLGGDDGAGSSALAMAIALRCDAPTLWLTSEMHPDRLHERALASWARVPLDALRLGAIDDEARARLGAAALSLRDCTPAVDRLGHGGLVEVEHALDASPESALLVVDGLEGLLDRESGRDEALAFLVLGLKRLALARGVAILVLAHLPALDRERQNRRPKLADFGVRGAIGVHADLVLGLYREEMYDAGLGVTGATELLVLKQRDGALGYADLYFYAQWLRFEDVLDPEP